MQIKNRMRTKQFEIPVTYPNEVWTVDSVVHRWKTGDAASILVAMDLFSGLPQVLVTAGTSPGAIANKLETACRFRPRYPESLWIDVSFEFKENELQEWAFAHNITLLFGVTSEKTSRVRPLLKRLHTFLDGFPLSRGVQNLDQALEDWRKQVCAAAET